MDTPIDLSSRNSQSTNRVSSLSIKNQTSEISSDTIKSMFSGLKILGFEKMKFLCEHTFIKGVTADDIRNLITQSGLGIGKVRIDWLFSLNKEGVKKILEIISALQSKKEVIFAGTTKDRMKWECEFFIFRENTQWSLCTSREICISESALVLIEDFRAVEMKTILLNPKELLELFEEDSHVIDLTRVHRSNQEDVRSIKIAEANSSDLKVTGAPELEFLFNYVLRLNKDDQVLFIKENVGFVIQVILHCFEKNRYLPEQTIKDAVQLYQLYMAEFFPKKKAKDVDKLFQVISPPGQVASSPKLILSAEGDNLPTLHQDVQNQLFKCMSSTNDQLNFAGTNKSNYNGFAIFCTLNLRKDPEVEKLKFDGFSEIQIFIQYSRLRKQAGLNSLALDVLGPDAMEKMNNGLLSIDDAKKEVVDFVAETSGWSRWNRGPERYRRDGLLSQADINKMSWSARACLASRLAQFAINSRQLEIEQVVRIIKPLDDNFFVSLDVWPFDSWDMNAACNNLLSLFTLSKLTVKRYLELNDRQIMFITLNSVSQCIEQDKITVESALFLSELIDTYQQSGWYGLSLMITSTNSKSET